MISMPELTSFIGWCAVVNILLLLTTSIGILWFKPFAISIHSKMFSLNQEELSRQYFQYLAIYKLIILAFFVTPYIALTIMQQ